MSEQIICKIKATIRPTRRIFATIAQRGAAGFIIANYQIDGGRADTNYTGTATIYGGNAESNFNGTVPIYGGNAETVFGDE